VCAQGLKLHARSCKAKRECQEEIDTAFAGELDMDDGECLILGVEQVWAEGELMKRVQEISAAVHELFKQSKYGCTKEAGFEAWGKQLKLLQHALNERRIGMAPASCAVGACDSSQHASEVDDYCDMGDIEERDDGDLGDEDLDGCAGRVASGLPVKRKEPEAPGPLDLAASDGGGSQAQACRARSASPQISEQQMHEYERTCGQQEGMVHKELARIVAWLERVKSGAVSREDEIEAESSQGGASQGQSAAQRLGATLLSAVSNLELGSSSAKAAVVADASQVRRMIADVDEANEAYAHVMLTAIDDEEQMDRLCNQRDACAQQLRKQVLGMRKFMACQHARTPPTPQPVASRPEPGHAASPPALTERQPLSVIARRKVSSAAPQEHEVQSAAAQGGVGGGAGGDGAGEGGGGGGGGFTHQANAGGQEDSRIGGAQRSVGVSSMDAVQGYEEEEQGEEVEDTGPDDVPDPYACLYSDDDVEL